MTPEQRRAINEARHELAAWANRHATTLEYLDTTFGPESRSKPFKRSLKFTIEFVTDYWLDCEQLEDHALDSLRDKEIARRERADKRRKEKEEDAAFEARMEAEHPGYIARSAALEAERKAALKAARAKEKADFEDRQRQRGETDSK